MSTPQPTPETCSRPGCGHPIALHDDVHCKGSDWCACRGIKITKIKPAPVEYLPVKASLETEEYYPGHGWIKRVIPMDTLHLAENEARRRRRRKDVRSVRVLMLEGTIKSAITFKARFPRLPRAELAP